MISSAFVNTTPSSPTTNASDVATENLVEFGTMKSLADYFNAYATIPILAVGLFGNILTMRVFNRQTNWDRGTIHYFFYLAVSDTACLLIYGLVEWVSEGLKFATDGRWYFDLINYSAASCKSLRYIWNVFGSTSAWLIVSVTVERYVAICHPLRRDIFTVELRRKVIAATFLLWITYHIPGSAWAYNVKPLYPGSDDLLCTYQEPNQTGRIAFAYAKLLMMYAVPVLVVLVFNTLIVVGILRGRKSRNEMMVKSSRFETRASKTLLIISTVFLVTMIPASVAWLTYFHLFMVKTTPYTLYEKSLQELIFAFGKFANTLSMINYSINFLVYSSQYDFYKPTAKKLLCCRAEKGEDEARHRPQIAVVLTSNSELSDSIGTAVIGGDNKAMGSQIDIV